MPPQIAKAEEPSLCVSLLQCMFQSDFVIWEESSYLPFSVKLLDPTILFPLSFFPGFW